MARRRKRRRVARMRKRSSVKLVMAIIGLVVNALMFPGLGSILAGRVATGIIQMLLMFVAIIFHLTLVGMVVSVPLGIIVWIWGIITCVRVIMKRA